MTRRFLLPLLLLLCLGVAPARLAAQEQAQRFTGPHRLEFTPLHQVRASLRYQYGLPGMVVQRWFLMAPVLQELPGQGGSISNLSVSGFNAVVLLDHESSVLLRPIYVVDVPAGNAQLRKSITVELTYWATLYQRQLRPGPAPGVAPLPGRDRALYSSPSATLNYDAADLRQWIVKNDLFRRAGENDLAYGYRAYRELLASVRYASDAVPASADAVAAAGRGDAAGLSILYCAVLRASGVPARPRFGRLIQSGQGDAVQTWAMAEFFADGVGWVPVDLAAAKLHDDQPILRYFGYDAGQMITQHVDTDLQIKVPGFGLRNVPFNQRVAIWSSGDIDANAPSETAGEVIRDEKWTVTVEPIDPLLRRTTH